MRLIPRKLKSNRIRVNQLEISRMASTGEDKMQREYNGTNENWLEKVPV